MMPVDHSALLDAGGGPPAGSASHGGSTGSALQAREDLPWAGARPRHTVDVQKLRDASVRAEIEDVDLASCCGDRHAAKVVFGLGSCCFLFVVLPLIGFSLLPALHPPQPWPVAVTASCGALLALGLLLCCGFLLPALAASINPPPPADCVPPLVAREENPTHAEAEDGARRVAVVYNPHAGKGMAGTLLQEVVLPTLRQHGVEVEEVPTKHVGHAREIGLEKDLTGLSGLVVMGGDGTLHEVANGLLARGSGSEALPPVGLIPLGSGNALASDFRQNQRRRGCEVSLYRELEAVAEWASDRIADGRTCNMDVLEVATEGQKLAAVAVVYFGLICDIDVIAEPLRWMGPGRFDVAGVWGILKRRPMAPCRIAVTGVDGSVRHLTNVESEGGSPWLSLALNLGQHWSDSMRTSPFSQLDDGVAELNILKCGRSRQQLLKAFNMIGTGSHLSVPNVEEFYETVPFTELTISFPLEEDAVSAAAAEAGGPLLKPGIFNVDGEVFRHDGQVQIRLQPRRLKIFVDPDEECGARFNVTTPAWNRSTSPDCSQGIGSPNGQVGQTGQLSSPGTSMSMEFQVYPQRWLMMALFCLCAGANQIVWITFSPIAATTAAAYHVTPAFVNMLSLIFMAMYLPFTFAASRAIDRVGCRHALVIGIGLTALGASLRVVAGETLTGSNAAWALLAAQGVAAIGQPFLTNMPPKLANVWFPSHQRTIADTVCSMANPVGAAIGFILPAAITGGEPNMMNQLLIVEAAISIVAFLIVLPFFKSAPPTPPSASAMADVRRTEAQNMSAAVNSGGGAQGERLGSIMDESREALRDRDFLSVAVAFSFGLGTFNTLGTMIEQLVEPFGFSQDDASALGALTIIAGVFGAAFCAVVLGYTHNFRSTLFGCFFGATVAAIGLALALPLGHGTQTGAVMVYITVGLLGFTMTPVMPVAFETSVELMHPSVGEAVLSGLCVGGGQVVGMVQTLVLQALCGAGYTKTSLWIIGIGIFLGSVGISFLRGKSVGARRRRHETLQRRSSRNLARSGTVSPAGPASPDSRRSK